MTEVVTRDGDTADQICLRHLGSTADLTEKLLALNPGLSSHGAQLPAGLVVTLPEPLAAPIPSVALWD